jgi:hypothetical protein
MDLFVDGNKQEALDGQGGELYVHRRALKALHILFDMEVSAPNDRRNLQPTSSVSPAGQLKHGQQVASRAVHASCQPLLL